MEFDWEGTERKMQSDPRFAPETGKQYLIAFKMDSLEQHEMDIYKKDAAGNSTDELEKTVFGIKIILDSVDGKPTDPVNLPMKITSKTLTKDIKSFWENKDAQGKRMLYTWTFKFTKTGQGMQTKYRLIPANLRPEFAQTTIPQAEAAKKKPFVKEENVEAFV